MNRVSLSAQGVPTPAWGKRAKAFAIKVLSALGKRDWEVSLVFCDDAFIKGLNAQYRGLDEPTDVLSFSMLDGVGEGQGWGQGCGQGWGQGCGQGCGQGWGPGPGQVGLGQAGPGETEGPGPGPGGLRLAGDIVISLDTLRENARAFGVSRDEELRRLLIHGILHLSGLDHGSNRPDEPMLRRQEELLARLAPAAILEEKGKGESL